MGFETLLYEKDRGLGVLTLNRPDRLNALSVQVWDELSEWLDELERDDDVRVAIITGAGRAFCAGADIKERVEHENNLTIQRSGFRGNRLFRRMERMNQVFMAAVNGYAAGGGAELAMACDLRIASADAKFALPEVKLGILPGAGGTQRLPRLVGSARAKEIMFFGEFVDIQTCLEWGLVNRIVPGEQLMIETMELAQILLERPPLSLSFIKSAVNTGLQMDLDSGLEYESQCSSYLSTTEDRLEGMKAFIEKRKPNFKGR